MTTRTGRSTVRVVGAHLGDGSAYVRIGDGDEVRVRWRLIPRPVRWRCDAHLELQDCTHARAVVWHLTAAAMREDQAHD